MYRLAEQLISQYWVLYKHSASQHYVVSQQRFCAYVPHFRICRKALRGVQHLFKDQSARLLYHKVNINSICKFIYMLNVYFVFINLSVIFLFWFLKCYGTLIIYLFVFIFSRLDYPFNNQTAIMEIKRIQPSQSSLSTSITFFKTSHCNSIVYYILLSIKIKHSQ